MRDLLWQRGSGALLWLVNRKKLDRICWGSCVHLLVERRMSFCGLTVFQDDHIPEKVCMVRVVTTSQSERGPRKTALSKVACPDWRRSLVGSMVWREPWNTS